MAKSERILNLIALLRNTRRLLPAAEIREKIPGYADHSDDAFHRMFERDKVEIRTMGFTIEQDDTDAWGAEPGYRIAREPATIADPGLTADEMAALSLAAQVGRTDEGALGYLKLAGADDPVGGRAGWLLPRVSLDGSIAALTDAIARRKTVTFRYRAARGDEVTERTVDPHGLYHRGAWYLTGHDRGREDTRVFKLSRVVGTIAVAKGDAPDFDAPATVELEVPHGPWEGEGRGEASVAFAPEIAWWAERRTGAQRRAEREDGWLELAVPVGDGDAFVGWLAGFGDRAEALGPPDLRRALAAHLRALLGES